MNEGAILKLSETPCFARHKRESQMVPEIRGSSAGRAVRVIAGGGIEEVFTIEQLIVDW
jgi:hypothetical protein